MRLTRRRFCLTPALAGLFSRVLPAYAAPVTKGTDIPPSAVLDSTLRAYVDALIPADETPSGTALGVDGQLRRVAAGQPDYQDLLNRGLAWLHERAHVAYGRSFPELDEASRDGIIRQAATAHHNTLERMFFERTRADAFFHYYGRAESWRGIRHYRGPPQPLGFMEYTQAPRQPR